MDRRAWRATVHGVTKKSDMTKQQSMQACIYIHIYGDDQIPILDKGLMSGRGVQWLQRSWECFFIRAPGTWVFVILLLIPFCMPGIFYNEK